MRFSGWAAVYDRVDRVGDVMRFGCFSGAGLVPLLWQHRGVPVGEILVLREQARGLWIEAEVREAEVARLVRRGALSGLSVGYRAVVARQGAWREVIAAALIEVSLVAVPMQAGARITHVMPVDAGISGDHEGAPVA